MRTTTRSTAPASPWSGSGWTGSTCTSSTGRTRRRRSTTRPGGPWCSCGTTGWCGRPASPTSPGRTWTRSSDDTGVTPVLNQIELHPYFPQAEMRAANAELGVAHRVVEPDGQAAGAVRRAGGPGGRRGPRRVARPGGAALAAPARHAARSRSRRTPRGNARTSTSTASSSPTTRSPRSRRSAEAGRQAVRRRPRQPRGVLSSLVAAPTTPYLRVDLDRLRRNVRSTAEWAATNRMALRPHVKTHKSPEIARLQLGQGAVGLTVATLGEAEVFSQHGCADLFVAYPVHVEERATERLRGLAGARPGRDRRGLGRGRGASRPVPRAVRRRGGRRGRLRPAPHRLRPRGGGLGGRRRRAGRAPGARGVHLPGAQLRRGRDGDRGGGRGPRPGHRTRGRRSARDSRCPWSAVAPRRASPTWTPACSPRPGRASTSSATPSSGSSAACRRSRSR